MFVTDTMTVDRPFRELLRASGLDSVSAVMNCMGNQLAAWSRSSDTIRFDPPSGGTSLFIKRYHYPTWRHRFRGMFRGTFFKASRARNEYRVLRQMRQLGIHAVRPVAYGERRVAHFLRFCFLITEAVPNAMALSAFIQSIADANKARDTRELRHEILKSLAREIRHMHAAGFAHRDLFYRNVLIRSLPGGRFEYYFLDASVGKRIRIPQRRQDNIVADLAALGAVAPHFCSKADQLRFLLEYLGTDRLEPEDRGWLRRVQKQSDRLRPAELERLRRGAVFDTPAASSAQAV